MLFHFALKSCFPFFLLYLSKCVFRFIQEVFSGHHWSSPLIWPFFILFVGQSWSLATKNQTCLLLNPNVKSVHTSSHVEQYGQQVVGKSVCRKVVLRAQMPECWEDQVMQCCARHWKVLWNLTGLCCHLCAVAKKKIIYSSVRIQTYKILTN